MRALLRFLIASLLLAIATAQADDVISRAFPEARADNVAKIKEICQEAILKVIGENYNPLLVDSEEYNYYYTKFLTQVEELCIVSRGGYGTRFNPIPLEALGELHKLKMNVYLLKRANDSRMSSGVK